MDGFAGDLVFMLNGREVRLDHVDPTTLLVDYLRSAEVGLTGTKWVCRQGGCGACTVMLSHNRGPGKSVHAAINSCLRPLCSLDGMAVTTTEGIGSAARGGSLDAVQKSIAENNGSQCGYCTPGWVMNLYSFLRANEGRRLTEEQMEAICDGNLCRCTGYRPILKAFKKFARELSGTSMEPVVVRDTSPIENDPAQKAERRAATLLHPAPSSWARKESDLPVVTHCLADAKVAAVTNTVVAGGQMQIRFDDEAAELREAETGVLTAVLEAEIEQFLRGLEVSLRDVTAPPGARPVYYTNGTHHWYRAVTLAQLYEILRSHDRDDVKLVVGNTSIGVYNRRLEDPHVLVDIAHIPELHETSIGRGGITLGSAVTYSDAAQLLDEALGSLPEEQLSTVRAARTMVRRTAGTIVRNAASLGGNTMMVTSHVKHGEPFPSDLFPVLCASGATLTVGLASSGDTIDLDPLAFVARWNDDEEFRAEAVLLRYVLPLSKTGEFVEPYKVALREVNAHALVNACFRVALDGLRVADCTLVVSGTGPLAFRATRAEKALTGNEWTRKTLSAALAALSKDVQENIEDSRVRMSELPDIGITEEYRRDAATAFFYKFIVGVSSQVSPELVDDWIKSAGMRFVRPVSHGTQVYPEPVDTPPLGLPVIKRAAFLQATGEATYTEEMPFPQNGLHAVIVVSPKALATYAYVLPDGSKCSGRDDFVAALRAKFPGVHDYVTADDVPAQGSRTGGMANDEPYLLPFAPGQVNWFGQPLGVVLARTAEEAEDAAYFIRTHCIQFKNAGTPILTLEEAIKQKSIFPDAPATAPFITHAYELMRAGSDMNWADEKGRRPSVRKAKVNGKNCVVVADTIWTPDQTHFYMQPNGCWVVPEEDDTFSVYPASQSPMEIHTTVASALGLPFNKVKVQITRVGGGFGGKT
ncbi:MAG TPA: FAD binding domain-containing protein, partial [Thermoanaerobaculia bacterium]|nr:FAD binding domain-containing protein [Thermoanaerobaculia bacterium]